MNHTPGAQDLLSAMPKVEIHVHLEGAQTPEAIWAMAERNGVSLPARSLEEWKSFYSFRDFAHFIDVFIACSRCMRTAADFAAMTVDFHRTQAAQQVLYTEAFLSASLFVGRIPTQELIAALADACAEGRERYGVEVRFIPDIARNFPDSQRDVLDFTLAGQRDGLFVGLGLGGIEAGYPPSLFTETFARARDAGLHVVAHGGEGAGADHVRDAVLLLGAERIGHGIRALEDAATVELLRSRRIPMEVCPVSNYRTGVVAAGDRHPIFAMLDAGLFCTVNSDDPSMFGTSLVGEYRYLASQGMTQVQLQHLAAGAIDATFLTAERKQVLWDIFAAFTPRVP